MRACGDIRRPLEAGVTSHLLVLPEVGHGGPAFEAADVRQAIREFLGAVFD